MGLTTLDDEYWEGLRLHRVLRAAFSARGLAPEAATGVADCLVEASLRGVDTHGVALVPTYLAELDGGRARSRPAVTFSGGGALQRLAAGSALGVVAGCLAADRAAGLAQRFGIGAVVVADSNHCGPASAYTLRLARRGLIGLFCTNSDALVAPHGGVRRVFGTNPLSLAAGSFGPALDPTGDGFCLDMATSQVAFSKVRRALAAGEAVNPGWARWPEGADDPAPSLADAAVLRPLGGEQAYKGQGLAMLVSLLTAVLAGEPADRDLSHLFAPPYDEPRRVAHFVLALDPAALGVGDGPTRAEAAAAFARRLADFLTAVRREPAEVVAEEVLAPGDPEARCAALRVREGVPVAPPLAGFFHRLEEDPSTASPAGP